jgi:UDP-2-acetamido-3-amino-2,3-dideoxy-glucuronate N-acetyltransferase
VRRGATLGANSTVLCGHQVGRYALVGAGAVVVNDVPDYALVVGVPARRIAWACRCGVTLSDSGNQGDLACAACGNRYRETGERLTAIREVQDGA